MEYDKIITKLVQETVTKLIPTLFEKFTFTDIVSLTKDSLDALGRGLIETVCKAVDDTYEKQRPKGVQIKNKIKRRTILTTFGPVVLTRRLYRDVRTEQRFFAVDRLLQLPKNIRIEPNMQAELIERAAKSSYRSAAQCGVSHQSVFNLVKKNAPKNIDVALAYSNVKNVAQLYIEADEDHIHLNTGKSAEVKLVYVHEGRERVNGRTQLIRPKFFVDISNKPERIWGRVADYVAQSFDVENAAVHLSGDGANWIKTGMSYFPNVRFHLDKFHVVKSITSATGGKRNEKQLIFNAIKSNDFNSVEQTYFSLLQEKSTYSDRKRTIDSLRYIDNNFDEISFDDDNLCSAEGHVSHVLSARMSSRPMGWSVAGATRIANLRAFMYNGGDFTSLIKYTECQEEKTQNKTSVKRRKVNVGYERDFFGRVVGLDGITDACAALLRATLRARPLC